VTGDPVAGRTFCPCTPLAQNHPQTQQSSTVRQAVRMAAVCEKPGRFVCVTRWISCKKDGLHHALTLDCTSTNSDCLRISPDQRGYRTCGVLIPYLSGNATYRDLAHFGGKEYQSRSKARPIVANAIRAISLPFHSEPQAHIVLPLQAYRRLYPLES
jgi:hypothetical protein